MYRIKRANGDVLAENIKSRKHVMEFGSLIGPCVSEKMGEKPKVENLFEATDRLKFFVCQMLDCGISLEKNGVSISFISDRYRDKYQVHADSKKVSDFFDDPVKAAERFLALI